MNLACDVLKQLEGKTFATAESCTGGGIGAALTAIPGSSSVYVGGIISYTNSVKSRLLHVDQKLLDEVGAVSAPVARAMAEGAREVLKSDIAVSVTGLAGPGGDEFGNPVGRVYIGYADHAGSFSREFTFSGDRDTVRTAAARTALEIVLEMNKKGV